MKNKTLFALAAIFTALANPALAEFAQVTGAKTHAAPSHSSTAQQEFARDYILSNDRKNFLILDKNNAEIVAYEQGREIFRTPVFIGRIKSDDAVETLGVTPAGVFNAVVWDIQENPDPIGRERSIIPFLCKKKQGYSDICYSIHPTRQVEAEEKAMATGNPEFRRLSNACVRVPEYTKIAAFLNKHKDTDPAILVILPFDVSKTRQYLAIPESYRPDKAAVPATVPALK